jgi:HEAT repeat protein
MHRSTCLVLLVCLLGCGGCTGQKSTEQLLDDLKSGEEKDRLLAVRLLPQHKGEAAQIIPALIDALKDKESDIRRGAALGLGSFGEQARDAIPALKATLNDHDARVREAAGIALSRIDPLNTPKTSKKPPGQ